MRKLTMIAFLLVCTGLLFAQTAGKVSGTVSSEDGQPLAGANVVVEGTSFGAAAGDDGVYYILEVPSGVYSVRVDYIGYKSHTVSNVRINSNLTSFVDFALAVAAVEGEAVEVVGEAPLLEISATNAVRSINSEQIENFASGNVTDMIASQAGVRMNNDEIYLRGGRQDEVGFTLDGVSTKAAVGIGVTGSLSSTSALGSSFNMINAIPEALQEVSIQSGGYSAEFGGANAGIVQQTMKTGGRSLSGSISYETDGAAEAFDTDSYGSSDLTFTLGGPITSNIRLFGAYQTTNTDNHTPMWWTGAEIADGAYMPITTGGVPTGDSLRLTIPNEVKGRDLEERNINGTLLFDLNPLVIRVSGAYNYRTSRNNTWPFFNMFNMDRQRKNEWTTMLGAIKTTYFLNSQTYFHLTVGALQREWMGYDPTMKHDDFEDWLAWGDGDLIHEKGLDQYNNQGDLLDATWNSRWVPPQNYSIYGFQLQTPGDITTWGYGENKRQNWNVKAGFASQIGTHELKTGFEYTQWTYRNYGLDDSDIVSVNQRISISSDAEQWFADHSAEAARVLRLERVVNVGYDEFGKEITDDNHADRARKPLSYAVYINDKIEKDDLVVNAGFRLDAFNLDDWVMKDYDNPPYDEQESSVNVDGFEDAETQFEFQPRLGLGFPISDKAVFHLQYGVFSQMPDLAQVFKSRSQMALYMGGQNYIPDPVGFGLEPVVSEQFEVGFGYQFANLAAFDVTVFAKNTTGQVELARNAVSADNEFGAGDYSYYRNGDFTNVSGIELTVRTRRINNFMIDANYTFTDARGTNSYPNSGNGHVEITGDDSGAPTAVSPLVYESKHKGNVNLDLRFGEGQNGILQNSGINLLTTFDSGHPFTLSTGGMGQRAADEGAVLSDNDPRNRTPVEPLGESSTPWVFNVDLKADKSFRAGPVMMTLFARVSNLFNTRQVLNVYNRTGNAYDDGFLTNPELSGPIVENQGENYTQLYEVVNLVNRQHYIVDYGFDTFGMPRTVSVGLTASF
ncbi:carboxypeptidase regulatory-like domain-containing protein [Candidatus Neomarinimicrobiota bacterium]